jgi:hypothetical protein
MTPQDSNDGDDDQMIEDVRMKPKPRTTLFREREDDKPMAPHNISTKISNMVIGLKFRAIIFMRNIAII